MLTVGSLFSGIGGLDLGLERAGMRVLWQCESDPYCRAVLRKHWPDVPCYEDVVSLATGEQVGLPGQPRFDDSLRVDVLAGGFPCQPVSLAGRRRGAADTRWLWPEYARVIRLLRPRYALMENVPGLLVGGGMAEVLGDLAALGYDAEWDCVAAAHVGAPHLRYRVFIVAYPDGRRQQERSELDGQASQDAANGHSRGRHVDGLRNDVADADFSRSQGRDERERRSDQRLAWPSSRTNAGQWLVEPYVGRVAHGVPSRVDRLRALGNAVVPQVAEVIGRMIVNDAG